MVRILHTSDWHLGRWLYSFRRDVEFAGFLEWLQQLIKERKIDYLLVSGDVFDTGTPSASAQKMYYRFLAGLARTGCKGAVVTAGNHDSASFLAAPAELLNALNIHIVSTAADLADIEREIVVFAADDGSPELVVGAVPFLKERDLREMVSGESYEQRVQNMAAGMARHYQAVYEASRRQAGETVPVVATGHLFATGGKVTSDDGVRDISVGSLGMTEVSALDVGFDYVALGHLHIAQTVGGKAYIRYSGSPLPIGFDEAGDDKEVVLVEFVAGETKIEPVAVPVFRKMRRICGDKEDIRRQIEALKTENEDMYLEVFYNGESFASGLNVYVDELVKGSQLTVCRIHNTDRNIFMPVHEDRGELEDISAEEMFERCLIAAQVAEDERDELRDLYRQVLTLAESDGEKGDDE